MAGRKEYEMLFSLNAQLGSGYGSTFKSAQNALTATQKEILALNKTQSDISAFQKQQGALAATRRELDVLQEKYNNVQKEIDETKGFSSALTNDLLSRDQEGMKTWERLEKQTQKLEQMDAALREAGVDTGRLGQESARLGSEMTELKQKQEGAAQGAKRFGAASSGAISAVHQAIAAAGIAVALKEIYEAFASCANASMDFESAMTGIAKTTDLSETELQAMSKSIKRLSTEIPATTTELAAVGEAAGQLGIAKENLLDFTVVMTELGTATNLSSEEAASALAKYANVTGMAADDFDRLGAAVVDLGNHFATTEADIVSMGTRLSAAGTLSNLNPAEIMGVATALSSVGIEAEAGGSAISKLMKQFETLVATGSDDLTGFAAVAGMTADKFTTAWKENAVGALNSFITGLKGIDDAGGSSIATLENLGITEQRMSDAVLRLSGSGNLLARAVETANTAWAENTALTGEAAKRYATGRSQLEMMKNAYNNVAVAIGDAYAPELQKAYSIGTKVFSGTAEFIEQNPALVKAVATFVTVVATATAALTGYAAIIKILKTLSLVPLFAGAGPIMLTVAGVAALTAGMVALSDATDMGVESVRELTSAAREMGETMNDANALYEDTMTSTLAAADVADVYIGKLEEMETAGINTDEEHRQYHNTLALLCQIIPELTDIIDLETDAINGGTPALHANTDAWKENAKAQAYQEYLTALNKNYSDVLVEAAENSIGLTAAQDDLETAEEKREETTKRMNALYAKAVEESEAWNQQNGVLTNSTNFLTQEYYDMESALRKLDDEILASNQSAENHKAAIKTDKEAITQAETQILLADDAIRKLTESTGENGAMSADAARQTKELQTTIGGVTSQITTLTEAYNAAYDAALASIKGQYDLWDTAASVAATSAGSINSALESQTQYWKDYNANLQGLTERSADIEGLSELISSFADGSTDSVNAIAGMAGANDEDLAAMVENWKLLQQEQQNASDNVADLKTDFTDAMDVLQAELAADIKAMNLGSEAAESGIATIQGFINGAEGMRPNVEKAYAKIAKAAMDAIDQKLDIHSPSRVMMEKDMMNAVTARNAVSAQDSGLGSPADARSVPAIEVHFHIEGNAAPDTVEQLRAYGAEFAEAVARVIEDRETDLARRAYR